MIRLSRLLACLCTVGAALGRIENMNGEYLITRTPNATGNFSTNWADYKGGPLEYFEILLGPITTLYSQANFLFSFVTVRNDSLLRLAALLLGVVEESGHHPSPRGPCQAFRRERNGDCGL